MMGWEAIAGILIWSHMCFGASIPDSPYFRKGYDYSPELKNFYKFQLTARNWTEANQLCSLEGATLAAPVDVQEAEYLARLVQNKDPEATVIYLGVQDILSEGLFRTPEGVPVEELYEHWEEGQPDNGVDKHCVVLDKQGYMKVVSCKTILPYVCKKTLASIEWNNECHIPDLGYKYNSTLNRCYKFHLVPKTWTDAFKVCQAEESYLAILNSKSEDDWLVKMTATAPKDNYKGSYLAGAVHLGFHDLFGRGYETIFGEPIEKAGFSKWGGGQPDSAEGPELCGSMFYDGTLNDIGCNTYSCFFICEHEVGFHGSPKFDFRLNEIL